MLELRLIFEAQLFLNVFCFRNLSLGSISVIWMKEKFYFPRESAVRDPRLIKSAAACACMWKKNPVLWTGLSALWPLARFFLWICFLLCWAFLFCRFILPGFSCLFRHTIKFKFSELFTHGSSVFLPFFYLVLSKRQLYSQDLSK